MNRGKIRPIGGLNLREKPNGQKIGVLPRGAEVEIQEEVTFFRVRTDSGNVGYVHGDYIEVLPSLENIAPSGAGRGVFPSPDFQITQFRGRNFIGKDALVDHDFVWLLEKIDDYADQNSVNIWVTSSTRNINEQVRGAIVPPASKSCHFVGHAIDMNVQHEGRLYNSRQLRKGNLRNLPSAVNAFIQAVRDDTDLRWGGDFRREDPVHIDDNLFRKQETIYESKLQSRIQQLNT